MTNGVKKYKNIQIILKLKIGGQKILMDVHK
jgi:hypothetical protein